MPANTKKVKSSKAGKNEGKSARDAITGLHADVNGTRIYSDTVYNENGAPDGDSPQGNALFKNRDERVFAEGGSAKFEFEMSKDAIILTSHVVGEISAGGIAQSSNNYRARYAWLGDFAYKSNGALRSGKIREIVNWSNGTDWNNGSVSEWGSVDRASTPWSIDSILDIFYPSPTPSAFTREYDYNAHYGEGRITGGPRESFFGFESSRYFQESWWDNPFNTNLV
jgi:hypothetical protein